MGNKEEFLKNIKEGKKTFIIGLLCLFFALILGVFIYSNKIKEMNDVVPLSHVKVDNVYASVDVNLMLEYFATQDYTGTEHKFYLVMDENFIYIVDLDDKNRESLQTIYDYAYNKEKMETPIPVKINGMTKKVPTDIKEIAIDTINTYNEKYDLKLNENNLYNVVYLDTYESPMSTLLTSLIFCFPFLIIGSILIFKYIKNNYRTYKSIKKIGNKWYNILDELDEIHTFSYEKVKLYLTKNYLINYIKDLEVLEYKDIIWIYPHEYRYNGKISQKSIYVVTKDLNNHELVMLNTGKKNFKLYNEIYNTFLHRMPHVLNGYTKENIDKVNELYQK